MESDESVGRALQRLSHALLAATLFLVNGCTLWQSTRPGEELPNDPDAITVIVHNNLTPPTAVTVYIVAETGMSTRLGQVTGASTQQFTARIPPAGLARLYARRGDGGEQSSNAVSLRPGQILEWDVFSNILSQRFGGAPDHAAPDSSFPGDPLRPATASRRRLP